MDGCGAADSRGRRRFLLLRVSHLLPHHHQVRLAEDQPCTGRRGHRRPSDGLNNGPRYGAVGHPPPRSRRGTLVRQAEEVVSCSIFKQSITVPLSIRLQLLALRE